MAYKILTPKELLAQTLAQAQKQRTPGYVDPNAAKTPTTTAAVVTPAPAGVNPLTIHGDQDKAVLAQFYGGGAAATPSLMDTANADFAQYQQSATGAANNALDAQAAQANFIINSGGIWATLQPIADKQMQDSIATLGQISALAKGNVEASRTALNVQEAADYDAVIKTIDTSIVAARKRTNEEMNQRGMFFSTVLDAAMGTVEAAGTTQKGQAAGLNKAALAKIASDMAVMSANIDIETIKGNASAVAQYTASMLQVVAQDAQTKQTAQALLASLNVQKAGVIDTIAAQTFAVGQQMKATAFNQQEQLNADAANAANTAFTQNLQTNAAAADATSAAQQQFVATMGQYAGDYQAAINALDPNDPLYSFKSGMLAAERQAKLVGIADQTKQDFLATIGQYAGDYQSQINKITNDGSASNDWQLAFLKIERMQKTSDQLVAQAAVDAVKAKADALALYQSNQLDLQWFNATTQRINTTGSVGGTSKAYAPTGGGSGSGGGGAGSVPSVSLTYSQANGVIDDYTKITDEFSAYVHNKDGTWSTTVTNPVTGVRELQKVDSKVPLSLQGQLTSIEPVYRASIAVRDKTSGTTTPGQPMTSIERADVVGFIQKVDDVSAGQNRGAWANELLSKLPANSLNTKQLNALDNYFNKGDRSVYNGS